MRARASARALPARCSAHAAPRTALSRATAVFAAIFMINSLALTYLGTTASKETPKTILEEAAESGKATPGAGKAPPPAAAPAAQPAAQSAPVPAAAPAAAPAPSSTPAQPAK